MKTQFINEAFRLQQLAGLLNEDNIELTDPELAVRWWGRMKDDKKQELLNKYLPKFLIKDMNNKDIYWLWKKQQSL